MAFHHPDFQKFYRCHGIKPIAIEPRTPWPNRAETAVRLFERQLALMTKYLAEEPSLPNPTFKNLVQKCCWARKDQLTIGGKIPLELAFGRPPKPIHDLELEDPAQLSEDPAKEDANALTLQRLALRAHQEARQLQDLRKDIARNLRSSDGPFAPGAHMFYWGHDPSKLRSGRWVRARVIKQQGSMVLVETTHSVVRVKQSKVRLDGDPWHSIQLPLQDDPAGNQATPPQQAQMVDHSGNEPLLPPGMDHSLCIKQTSNQVQFLETMCTRTTSVTTHEQTRSSGGCSVHIWSCP